MDFNALQLRQPAARDIVGKTIALAGVGSAFEAQFEWELHQGGKLVASGGFQRGSMGPTYSFAEEVSLEGAKGLKAGKATFIVNGWNAEDDHEPETQVEVIVIPGAEGFIPYQVRSGDTISKLLEKDDLISGYKTAVTTIKNIALASGLADPDKIRPGQILRFPI